MKVRRALVCAVALVTAVMVTSSTWAQTQPGAPPMNGGYQPPAMQPQQPAPQWQFQPSAYPEMYTDFPMADVRAVPPALVRAVIARAHLRRAHTTLDQAVRSITGAFSKSREWLVAMGEERQAWDALQAARARALQTLQSDPSYLAAIDLKRSLSGQLEDLREDRYSSTGELIAMATVKMGYAQTASAMEAAAVAADPDVQGARQRLRDASARLTDLRGQLDQNVRSSRDVLAARMNLEEARIAHLATDANFWATLNASQVALDYAYYLDRYQQYRYLSYGNAGFFWNAGFPNGWGQQPWVGSRW
jgi:hypothetical protein